jgi:hypothetical protein
MVTISWLTLPFSITHLTVAAIALGSFVPCAWAAERSDPPVLSNSVSIGSGRSIPVTVTNTLAARNIDRPEAQPVNGSCGALSFVGFTGPAKCHLYTVPVGKRLVVETVSYHLVTDATESITELIFGSTDQPDTIGIMFGSNTFDVVPILVYSDQSKKYFRGSQALRFYVEASQSLAGQITYSGGSDLLQRFSFSGYLVDK